MKRGRKQLKKLCAFLVVTGIALGFLAITPIPGKRTLTFGNLVSDNQGNRALAESTDSSTDASNDINLEILESYVVLPISRQKYQGGSGLFIELAITNHSSTPIQIGGRGLVAQLVADDGTVLPLQKSGEPSAWCSPLNSGEIRRLSVQVDLFLNPKSRQLDLRIYDGTKSSWKIEGISLGTYQLNYSYSQPTNLALDCPEAATAETEPIEGSFTSFTAVDSMEIRIVEPLEIDSNTVELDGVRLEIAIPERTLRVPDDRSSASTPVEVGIKITNHTPNPLRFTSFDTLALSIVNPNGQSPERSSLRNWTIPARKADVPLLESGESVTFFLDAKLFWEENKLRLGGSDGFGGYWYIEPLEVETYLFSMGYARPNRVLMYDELTQQNRIIEEFWEGVGNTPLVEVRLIEP